MDIAPTRGDQAAKVLVLSVATRFARKLLSGEKTVELRRRFPEIRGRQQLALLYSSREDRSIVASCSILSSERLELEAIWDRFKSDIAITRSEFDAYFSGLSAGYAIRFRHINKLVRPISLGTLQRQWSFTPPQSYCYVSWTFFESILERDA